MRTVVGYRDGSPVWSENVPIEEMAWPRRLGGTSITEAMSATSKSERARKGWETRRRATDADDGMVR